MPCRASVFHSHPHSPFPFLPHRSSVEWCQRLTIDVIVIPEDLGAISLFAGNIRPQSSATQGREQCEVNYMYAFSLPLLLLVDCIA